MVKINLHKLMKNYYQILGVKIDASSKEIDIEYQKLKSANQLTPKIQNIYNILSDYHLRKNYDESIKKNILSFIKIPFFGYDFDEKYVKEYSSLEQKRYLIENNKFLIYEKENINGKIHKNYYIEHNGKKELISDEKIKKLKEEYYEKNSSPRLLKDSSLNKVLSK